jgi:DNA-binding MarR family transcriptional regulator
VKGEFLGPRIPLSWLGPACKLGSKAVQTALAIWFLAGLRKRMNDLKLSGAIVERFHVSPSDKSKALKKLEGAGLIRVQRQPRKNPRVTILEVDEGGDTDAA